MPTNAPRETATIYQFPVGGRAGLAPRRSPEAVRFADLPNISYGSSWYHDEAIREAAEPLKN
ncbi:DUF2735 domain-containing protein [Pseudolabrys sp. FHR47]|uniref:DUF2735 domain-containing protein n=1 Tax=Pseudolabrys sp. FHR47 TaxID=2562284 RepID=UPI0010BEDF6A|nr:DUF2735 domain-containing protein [Pseudolabrys sp. FHR47]